MVKKRYEIEREGQIDFFENYGIPYDADDSILIDNTDGVYNGCLLEFKLNISNPNKVLFQAVKYLSHMRVKGESVPAAILLIDLNNTAVYVYRSEDYRNAIQAVYAGAASKDNAGFVAGNPVCKHDYSDMVGSNEVRKLLKSQKTIQQMYMPVDIDENCIVGWAGRYYRELPSASKGDFLGDDTGVSVKVIGEIRDPRHFAGLIRPYTGKTNEKFKYLMDCLNDRLSKKDLGAFYTPELYAKKAAELVMMAVDRVPAGNDYIILDRCAGTGNLEAALIGLYDKNGDELISHCVVSTYEYYEYKVLQERIGDGVRDIIPPSEANVVYENGKVANADAMSEEYINNPIIKGYVDDPKCTIIMFENPPYQDSTAATFVNDDGSKHKVKRGMSYVGTLYRQDKTINETKASMRELSNLFIWSGFNIYMRQPTDSYIIFSPLKYFKSVGLVNKKFMARYIMNREYFHATANAITCIYWSNENDYIEKLTLPAIEINGNIVAYITSSKCHSTLNMLYDKRKDPADIETNVWLKGDGTELLDGRADVKSYYNDNIIGCMGAANFPLDPLNRYLIRQQFYHHGMSFYLRKDNYLDKLPLFVAKLIPLDYWYEKNMYFTTSDGGDAYTHDPDFLKSCLIYTCLSNQNKCLTFDGSDGRHYQNELCFDNGTLASADLCKYGKSKDADKEADEEALLALWDKILSHAKVIAASKGYDPADTLGVYQITKELNTYHQEGTGKAKKNIYDHPELNGNLDALRVKLKEYYKKYITPKMFEYELIK